MRKKYRKKDNIVAERAMPEFHDQLNIIHLTPEYPRHICLAKREGYFTSNAAKMVWRYLEKNIVTFF
ncbi:hypothetical protein OAH87_05930 [Marinomonas sp.]|nr:hypothetical protein [Marinomonas sp.]MDB4837989.1 hypothetical protein [Marinomonas sp.]